VDRDLSQHQDLTLAELTHALPPAGRAGGVFAPSPWIFGTPVSGRGDERPISLLLATEADPAAPAAEASRLVREWSARLAARGHRVTVLTPGDRKAGAADFEILDGVEIVRFDLKGRLKQRYRAAVRGFRGAASRLARERGFEAALLDHPAAAAGLHGACPEVTRLYLYQASEIEAEGRLARRLRLRAERAALLACNGALVPSRFAAADLAARHADLGLPVTLLPGGVDAARFQPCEERWDLRHRLGLPASAFLILTVGPLRAGMGLENLITAMAGVTTAYPEAHLVIVGTGPLESDLRRQVVGQRLGRAVTFALAVPEESEYHAAADLFVMPATRAPLASLAALEALACGTPVFATPVGALPELVTHLDPRALFAGTGAGAIADGIIRHLPDLHHDEALRRRCRQFALEHYDWQVLIPQLEACLQESVARRRGRQPASMPPAAQGLVPRWPCFE
jgi:glycosyltransferase involved in cell wall biosynthesis